MQREAFEHMLKTQDIHWWFKGKRRILQKIIEKEVFSGTPCDILEVGCGTGSNLPMLAAFGNVTALELDDYAREHLASRSLVSVSKGWLPDGMEAVYGKHFDLVCIFDVLEHIERDEDALAALRNYVRPGGRLLLTVPAYQWMFGAHDRMLGHYRRYTRGRLRELCLRQGYEILYAGYINVLLFPLMAVARLIDRFFRNENACSTGTGVPPFGFNALLYAFFSMESFWIPYISSPFGGSVVLLCGKGKG